MSLADLPGRLGGDRLAVALVDAVPAGIYARESLTHLGLWAALGDRLAETDNVRAALALVATGEAPYGIVYATDAEAEPDLSVVAELPADSHAPIVYPIGRLADSDHPDAPALLNYLDGPHGAGVFRRHGFEIAR